MVLYILIVFLGERLFEYCVSMSAHSNGIKMLCRSAAINFEEFYFVVVECK